jgi:oligoendopeptidase F
MSSPTDRIPTRAEVAIEHTWDLSRLYTNDSEWEAAFQKWEASIEGYAKYRGKMGESWQTLLAALLYDLEFGREGDKLGTYAFLKSSEDVSNSTYQGLKARYLGVAAKAAEAGSFFRPEILAIPDQTLQAFVNQPEIAPHRLTLERLIRFKAHTLNESEERILAMQIETAQTAHNVFSQLNDADLKFGQIEIEPGRKIDLSHGTYMMCLEHPNREVRKTAFHQYYSHYQDHANTLSAALAGTVKQDVFSAKVRNYKTAREAAMFPDNVPASVYDNLVAAVRANLPAVHKYYAVRKKAMKLDAIHFYDVYVPIQSNIKKHHTWEQGVELVLESLKPLGQEYGNILATGLRGRWCDRYENKGKRSGAFSAGCYDSDPYILMNYKDDVFDHVFTLTHEAGHSMHTHFSKSQPYQYSNYTIFVAEVASTFNEQLLGRYLMARATDDQERIYYINREIDDIRRTIVRQTMFAEYEKIIHDLAERNEPLTVETLRGEYRKLLDAYFGPDFNIDAELSLEGLRIPHFYNAFYVYKYSTGLSAAIALAERVTQGGSAELNAYLSFLKAGSSKDPLDLLRDAGVDMETPEPVNAALKRFNELVEQLDQLVG